MKNLLNLFIIHALCIACSALKIQMTCVTLGGQALFPDQGRFESSLPVRVVLPYEYDLDEMWTKLTYYTGLSPPLFWRLLSRECYRLQNV